MEREIRCLDQELRAIGNGRRIEGLGIVFNSESRDLGGFIEVIKPEAVEGVLERSDILCLLNHDVSKGVLARCTNGKGSLDLKVEKRGVKYGFEAPNTNLGNEVIEGVKRGDIRTSSFAFSVAKDGQTWEKRNGKNVRTITKFETVYDVSPVYREAYQDTTVALRSLQEFQTKTKTEYERMTANMTPRQILLYDEHLRLKAKK